MVKYVNHAGHFTATIGTGDIDLDDSVAELGCVSFSAAGLVDGDQIKYLVEDNFVNGSPTSREVGIGTLGGGQRVLQRTLESSTTGSLLYLSGNARVFATIAGADFTAIQETLTTKVNVGDIVDDTSSYAVDKPGSANQIRILSGQIVSVIGNANQAVLDALAAQAAAEAAASAASVTAATVEQAKLSAFAGSSATSVTVPVAGASVTLTTNSDKSWVAGQQVAVQSSGSTASFSMQISSYSGSTLIGTVVASPAPTGSGAHTDWLISATSTGVQSLNGKTGAVTLPPATIVAPDNRRWVGADPSSGSVLLLGDRSPAWGPVHVIIGVGQSQMGADQAASQPGFSITPRRRNRAWMFDACGLSGLQGVDASTLNLSKIVPAKERLSETFLSGFFMEWFDYLDRNDLPSHPTVFINVAMGGALITQISKGTLPYTNMTTLVQALKTRYGTVIVDLILFSQGTSNHTTTKSSYKTSLSTFYSDVNTDLKAITGQPKTIDIYCEHWPTVTGPTYTGGGLGPQDAMLELHAEALASPANPRIMVGVTTGDEYYGDSYHLAAYSRFRSGARWANAIQRYRYEGFSSVFWVTGGSIAGNIITFTTNAQYDLVIDTLYTTGVALDADRGGGSSTSGYSGAHGKNGVFILNGSNVVQAINTLTVSGRNIIANMGGLSPAVGWVGKFGRIDTRNTVNGPGGYTNIRDTNPDVFGFDNGYTVFSNNMACCEMVVT